jgi:hypothetical protein
MLLLTASWVQHITSCLKEVIDLLNALVKSIHCVIEAHNKGVKKIGLKG